MDNKSKKFRLVAERLKRKLLLRTDKDLAEKLGLQPKAFNARKQAGSIPYPEILDLANHYNIDLNWLLTGEDFIYKDTNLESNHQNPESEKKNIIVVEHSDLVKEFDDQERAKKINHNLLKIEKNSRQAFRDIDNYIEGIANGLDYAFKKQDDVDELNDPKKTSDNPIHGNGTDGK